MEADLIYLPLTVAKIAKGLCAMGMDNNSSARG